MDNLQITAPALEPDFYENKNRNLATVLKLSTERALDTDNYVKELYKHQQNVCKEYGKDSLNFELCNGLINKAEAIAEALKENTKAIAKYIAEFDENEEPNF